MIDNALSKVIIKAQKGHNKSFEVLINRYGRKVYGYIYSLTKDKNLSDDLYQEVWIKVIKNIRQFKSDQPFMGWLIIIARNTVYDTSKRKKVINLPIHLCEPIASHEQSPENILLEKERLKEIDHNMQQLNARDQNLIILRCFEGYSYEEISGLLSIEIRTVKWQLQEAKKRLRKLSDKEVLYEM